MEVPALGTSESGSAVGRQYGAMIPPPPSGNVKIKINFLFAGNKFSQKHTAPTRPRGLVGVDVISQNYHDSVYS